MKNFQKALEIVLILAFLFIPIRAQNSEELSARSIPTEVEKYAARVKQVMAQAESYFEAGAQHLRSNNRLLAREAFDKAVDVILESGLDVRSDARLRLYYLELVQRIYNIEVPSSPSHPSPGFKSQKYEPAESDSLSTLLPGAKTPKFHEACKLTVKQSPALRGLRLGMSSDGVLKALQGVKVLYIGKPSRPLFGWIRTSFIPVNSTPHTSGSPDFSGVSRVELRFLDSKVSAITIVYDASIKWENIKQFKDRIMETLGLPNSWEDVRGSSDRMKCDGFDIYLSVSGAPEIMIIDQSELPTIEERTKAWEEKKRQTFKP